MNSLPLRARLIHELRTSPLPISTTDLALLCAFRLPNRIQRTNNELQRLERMRVVRRHAPVVRGEGRPANRWSLVTAGAGAGRAA